MNPAVEADEHVLLGREAHLATLAALRAGVAKGRAAIVSIVGAPGIGKTSLAAACRAAASAEGFATGWGSGWPDGGAPALWPWEGILRDLDAQLDLGADVNVSRTRDGSPELDSFGRFRSVVELLDRGRERPVLIVIDDAHLTDPDTIRLARFLVRSMRARPVLVVLTFVDAGDATPPHIAASLDDVLREGEWLALHGIDADDTRRMVERSGDPYWSNDIEGLLGLTGGNPLLLREALSVGEQLLDRPTDSVRRLVRRRLAPFPADDRRVLAAMAVLGCGAAAADIAEVAACTLDEVHRVDGIARSLGVIRGAGCYEFVHGLVRDALLADVGDDAVGELRSRAADHLESTPALPSVSTLVRVAHLRLSIAAHRHGTAWKQALAAVRAAVRADLDQYGHEEAGPLLLRTTRILDAAGRSLPPDLLVELGRAEFAAGHLRDARSAFRRAVDTSVDDPVMFARALAGLGGLATFEHRSETEVAWFRQLLDRAIDGLGGDEPELRLRLEARRAADQWFAGRGSLEEIAGVVDAGRSIAGRSARAETLSVLHHASLGPAHAAARREIADELVELSLGTGDAFLSLMGPMWRTVDLVLDGDHAATRSLRELRRHSDAMQMRTVLYVVRLIETMTMMRSGRLADAEASAAATFEYGVDLGEADAAGYYGAQLMTLRWLQGRSGELVDQGSRVAASPTLLLGDEVYAAAAAAIAADAGGVHLDDARRVLDRLRHAGLDRIPTSSNWLMTMFCVVEAAHRVGDADLAGAAYDLLLPFAHLPVMGSLGAVCLGPVTRVLARAAAARGRADDAIDHFEQALVDARRLGNLPMVAIIRGELGAALLDRAAPGDRARGRALVGEAMESLRQMGLHARSDALSSLVRDGGAAVGPTHTEVERRTFHRVGRQWEVSGGGERAVLRDSAGLHHIAQLLRHPGLEIAAAELAGSSVSTSSQEVLDDAARIAYQRRVSMLTDELERADRAGDVAASTRAQGELDLLVEHLRIQTRLDGRTRSFSNVDERARTAVQKAIRRNVDRIERQAPSLGAELGAALHTGLFCRYAPLPDGADWHVDLEA